MRNATLILLLCSLSVLAQNARGQVGTSPLPQLVKFSGSALDLTGKPQTGIVGVTFALYRSQKGGAPLWIETQNVQTDPNGHFTVLLGSGGPGGLPLSIFASGEARWLGVQVQGQPEQSRVLMVAVPYAMKAADAETLGGLPASAFMLAVPQISHTIVPKDSTSNATSDVVPPLSGSGTTNYLPIWTSSTNLGNSIVYQSTSKYVGINTTSPTSTLDVNGAEYVRGQLFLPASGTANSSQGYNSRVQNFTASAYNSNTHLAENHSLQWVAEPLGNNTPSPSATLNLRFFSTGGALETGFSIGSDGIVRFAPNQTFPGMGTVTSVGSGTGLTGGPITTSGTLSLDTSFTDGRYAQLNNYNSFNYEQYFYGGFYSPYFSTDSIYTSYLSSTSGYVGSLSGSSGTFSCYGCFPLVSQSNGRQEALQAQNFASPSTLNLELTAFDYSNKAVFYVDTLGNMTATGTKSAAVPLNNGKMVRMFAVESAENWFDDYGSASLVGGVATVQIEKTFRQTITNDDTYHVFLTPNGDCKGLYVSQKTPSSFEVRELGDGQSNVAFDYRIVGHRAGHEKERMTTATLPLPPSAKQAGVSRK